MACQPKRTLSPASDRQRLTAAVERLRLTLSTILPLLDAFNHRHRNQHRASHWWSAFGALRRSLHALLSRCPESPSRDTRPSRLDHVVTRAVFMYNHTIPRAFVSFSQLAADNQHAPLGLMLLAALGQAHGSLQLLLDCAGWSQQHQSAPRCKRQQDPGEQAAASSGLADRGVAVSRKGTPRAEKPPVAVFDPATTPTKCDQHQNSPGPRRVGEDAAETRSRRLLEQEDADKVRKKTKKKKKKNNDKGGDELAQLFDSLD